MTLDPDIAHYGQWALFLASVVFGVWGTGYALWVSVQLGTQWYEWLGRKQRKAEKRAEVDVEHYREMQKLELAAVKARQEMQLEREKAQQVLLNHEFGQMASEGGGSDGRVKSVG